MQLLNDGVAEIMVVIHVPVAEHLIHHQWFYALASLFNKGDSK